MHVHGDDAEIVGIAADLLHACIKLVDSFVACLLRCAAVFHERDDVKAEAAFHNLFSYAGGGSGADGGVGIEAAARHR